MLDRLVKICRWSLPLQDKSLYLQSTTWISNLIDGKWNRKKESKQKTNDGYIDEWSNCDAWQLKSIRNQLKRSNQFNLSIDWTFNCVSSMYNGISCWCGSEILCYFIPWQANCCWLENNHGGYWAHTAHQDTATAKNLNMKRAFFRTEYFFLPSRVVLRSTDILTFCSQYKSRDRNWICTSRVHVSCLYYTLLMI